MARTKAEMIETRKKQNLVRGANASKLRARRRRIDADIEARQQHSEDEL